MNTQLIKRWAISTLITFLGGFAFVLLGDIDSVTIESFQNGSILGLFFVATRSGVKGVLELFLNWRNRTN